MARCGSAVVMVMAAMSASEALGQMTPSGMPDQAQVPIAPLDPITVTGTRTERSLYDVPGSASTVTRQTVDQRQPQRLDDLLRDLPGVEISGGPRPGAGEPNVRGLEGERVLIRLDGARQDFQSGHKGRIFLDPDLIKQVDVVRGPNSVLYGSGALAGVINITMRDATDFLRPGEKAGYRVKTGFQSVNDMVMAQVVGFANVAGFDLLGGLTYRNSGDYSFGGKGHLANSGAEVVSGLVKGGYTFQPGQRLGLSLIAFDDRDISTTAPNTAATTAPADRTTQQLTGSVTYDHRDPNLPWLDLKAVAYHNRVYIREKLLRPSPFTGPRLDETAMRTSGTDVQNTSRFAISDAVAVALTYGVDGRVESTDGERNNVPRPEFPDAHGRVAGAFVQPEIRLWDSVSLTPGLRFDYYYRKPDSAAVGPSLSESRVSPRIGVQWDATKWFSAYALYAEAFRAPSLSELYVSGTHFPGNRFIPNPNLKPEIGKNKEVGVTLKLDDAVQPGDKLRFRVSGFHTNYRDFIDLIVTATTTTPVNVTRATIWGVELEGGYMSGNWFGTLGASIIRGDNKSTHQPLASIPGDKVALTVGYQFPEWDLVIGGRSKLVAAQNRVPTGVRKTDGYALFDLFLSWQPSDGPLRGARFDLGIDNLTDKRYRDHLTPNLDPGRNFKLAASFQF
ncbi:TonB-dependent hemoglobin/transferrin/lactoferrin family receptor [Vineibacter terrae]|uniref:TonB-dependent hemoglobin/transferrin/lactoferrin family receptor n=1 Tax=Vineibacter terrae TaxID=2586908 RepID=A0A5C8PVL3_9HYPH|nr:TonB-dependent hemoglobin/transferrin/lactoferrin family receptor [Vineibacter terrae]TXL82023.1 TonB-dependent hemoglobin/transferrin/lactoferrin family receptor [Vineibacter terrae]